MSHCQAPLNKPTLRPRCRPGQGSPILGAPFAALFLLLGTAFFAASTARAAERVVRKEAPFPTILDPATASDATPLRYEVLRGDFHMHTVHSDGVLSPVDRVIEAWEYGFDVIAITDHRNFQAYAEAKPMAETLGLLLLRGMETGIREQEHLVALDFSADYEPRDPHRWAETPDEATVFYRQQWPRLAAAGGFVLYPHPHVGLRETMLWGIGQSLLGGIELKNDFVYDEWGTVESHGTYWYPFAFEWAVEHNLTVFANSDVHQRREGDQAVTLVLARDWSEDGVMEALRGGRTVAWFNNMLCGHEWVLDMLMASLVEVRFIRMADNSSFLRFQNHGPVALTALITGTPLGTISLGPYEDVLASVRRLPNTVTITWTNVYTRPTENLSTTYTLSEIAE